jgi:hypothetical protein
MLTGHSPVRAPNAPTLNAAVETVQAVPSSSDERWDAWQAKGAAHDRAVRRKLAIAGPVVAAIAAFVWYALVIR